MGMAESLIACVVSGIFGFVWMEKVPTASVFNENNTVFGVELASTEKFIGVLSLIIKNTGKMCAELFCYHTKDEKHKALGFHSYTDTDYRGIGMNTLLRQVAVCLIPKIVDNIAFIGSNSNEVSIHIMTKHLGCTCDEQDLKLNTRAWKHIALVDNNFTIAGLIETVSAFVREKLHSKLLHTGKSVDEFIQSVLSELFPTGIKRKHSALTTTSDSGPSCSKKQCPDPVTL